MFKNLFHLFLYSTCSKIISNECLIEQTRPQLLSYLQNHNAQNVHTETIADTVNGKANCTQCDDWKLGKEGCLITSSTIITLSAICFAIYSIFDGFCMDFLHIMNL